MFPIPNALTARSIIIVMLGFICVAPVLAQRPSQNTPRVGENKQASGGQSLEQAVKKLKSLNDQVREARKQQADERVAASQTIAALEAENKQLRSARDQNELRIQLFEGRERAITGNPIVEKATMADAIETLLKEVTELRQILDRSLPSQSRQSPPGDRTPQARANDKESRSNP